MKTLLFIVLKIVEVVAYIFVVWLFDIFCDWVGISDWIDKMIDLYPNITISVLIASLLLCVIYLIATRFFQDWFTINKKWVDKSKDAIRHHLDKLRNRLAEEKLRETGSGRKNLEKVANAVMPTGKLQERVINIFQFLSFYGPDFISLSIESLDPEKLCHQVVEIEPSS